MARRIFNLERDLRTTDWLVEKVRYKEIYAQNLYAALCNNEFAPKDAWAILSNMKWNCISWRHAALLIAEMRENDNWEAWYGTGSIVSKLYNVPPPLPSFVEESYVTPEIDKDLNQIGWLVITQRWL